jgi:hypothetical protein
MKGLFLTVLFFIFIKFTFAINIPFSNDKVSLSNNFSSLKEYFKTYDKAILVRLKMGATIVRSSADSATLHSDSMYMIQKNIQLISILNSINPITYNSEFMQSSDPMVIFAAAIELYAEQNSSSNISNNGRVDPSVANCVKDVITGIFDIVSLIEDYVALIRNGAQWNTVRTLLWRTLKRYGGWMAAAAVIYEIVNDCF